MFNQGDPLNRSQPSRPDLALVDIYPMLRRRRLWILASTLGLFALMALYCLICTPKYDSTGIVELKKESTDALNLGSLNGSTAATVDALSTGMDLQTESQILQSNTLAIHTIEALHLENTKDFQHHTSVFGTLLSLGAKKQPTEPINTPLEKAPVRRARDLKIFEGNLKVKVESGSRLIDITYRSTDPAVAAAVVNFLIKGLTDYTFETRLNATSEASQWLSGQLAELRHQSESMQANVLSLQQGMGVFSSGATDAQGNPQVYSSALDRLQQATTALAAAKSGRILKQAIYENAKSGSPDLISGLAGNSMGQSQALNTSMSLVQTLRSQKATLQQQIDYNKGKFGDAYPILKEQENSIRGIDQEIQRELERVTGRAKSDFEVASQAERTTQASYDAARREAELLNGKGVELTIDKQEAENVRSLYEDLLKRLKEAGILEGWRSSNIAVVDPGRISSKPAKPLVLIYLAGATAIGLFLGIAAAFLIDNLDSRVQDLGQIEAEFSVLGVLPYVSDKETFAWLSGASATAPGLLEALRGVRMSLMQKSANLSPRVVLVTSAISGEGRSTFARSLAMILARQQRRVLLVDLDLRSRPVRRDEEVGSGAGMSELLLERETSAGQTLMHAVPDLANLTLMPAGDTSVDSVELLDSARMRELLQTWRSMFDIVILDGPPVLQVADVVPLATEADTTIVMVRAGYTPLPSLRRAFQLLESHANPARLRVVITGARNVPSQVSPSSHRSSALWSRGGKAA